MTEKSHYQVVGVLKLVELLAVKAKGRDRQPLCSFPLAKASPIVVLGVASSPRALLGTHCLGNVTSSNVAKRRRAEYRKMKSSSVSLELVPIQSGTNSSARYSAMASETKDKLRSVELRPTRTRVALAYMLFARGNRHVSAEMLFEEARQRKVSVSLATVYNTLHEFTRVGFLRQIAVDSSKSRYQQHGSSSLLSRGSARVDGYPVDGCCGRQSSVAARGVRNRSR